MRIFLWAKKSLLDLFFPKSCLVCGKNGIYACDECLGQIVFNKKQKCPWCKKWNDFGEVCGRGCGVGFFFDQMIVCCSYKANPLLKKLLSLMKYKFSEEVCAILGEILRTQFVYFSQYLDFKDFIFVPVPLHKKRFKYRGFNQAEKLCKYLCEKVSRDPEMEEKFLGVEVWDCLRRVKYQKAQAKLTRKERLGNLKDSFEVLSGFERKFRGRKVVLIDDVATTGTTLNECSRVLKNCGVEYICGLVIARE